MSDLMTAGEVVARSGEITYRQLDYWIKRGWITPGAHEGGSGSWRWFYPSVLQEIDDLLWAIDNCPHDHSTTRKRRTPPEITPAARPISEARSTG